MIEGKKKIHPLAIPLISGFLFGLSVVIWIGLPIERGENGHLTEQSLLLHGLSLAFMIACSIVICVLVIKDQYEKAKRK